jgi:hypothetical protein
MQHLLLHGASVFPVSSEGPPISYLLRHTTIKILHCSKHRHLFLSISFDTCILKIREGQEHNMALNHPPQNVNLLSALGTCHANVLTTVLFYDKLPTKLCMALMQSSPPFSEKVAQSRGFFIHTAKHVSKVPHRMKTL